MQDLRVATAATILTVAAVADTVLPTPEDWFPLIGWVDEAILWGLTIRMWMSYFKGEKLEDIFRW